MFKKVKKIKDSINLSNLNNILLIISLIIFMASLYFLNNKYLILLILVLIYEFYSLSKKNKYLNLVIDISFIITLGFILLSFIDLSFFKFDILKYIKILIKILFLISYFLIILREIKIKKINHLKNGKKGKRTFNELRRKKINYYKEKVEEYANTYIKNHEISRESDYYKLIEDNIKNKTKENLEEYVNLEYLRFFKNRAIVKKKIFDKINLVFILIHVIILLLVIFVR